MAATWGASYLSAKALVVASVLAVVGVFLLVSADGIRPPSIGDLLILAAATYAGLAIHARHRAGAGTAVTTSGKLWIVRVDRRG